MSCRVASHSLRRTRPSSSLGENCTGFRCLSDLGRRLAIGLRLLGLVLCGDRFRRPCVEVRLWNMVEETVIAGLMG
jgi:hypothetical protein